MPGGKFGDRPPRWYSDLAVVVQNTLTMIFLAGWKC